MAAETHKPSMQPNFIVTTWSYFWFIMILLVVHTLYNMELRWLFQNVPSRLLKYLSSRGKVEIDFNAKGKYYKLEQF